MTVPNHERAFAERPAIYAAWQGLNGATSWPHWQRRRSCGRAIAAWRTEASWPINSCFFSKALDALGAEPDAKFNDLEPGLRDALTVGRPIQRA